MAPCILTAPLGAGGQALSQVLSDSASALDALAHTLSGSTTEPADPGASYIWNEFPELDNYTGSMADLNNRIASPAGVLPDLDVYPIGANSGTPPTASILSGADARGGVGRSVRASYSATGEGQVVAWRTRPNGGTTTFGGYNPATHALVMQVWFRVTPGFTGGPIGWKWFEWWEAQTGFRNQVSPAYRGAIFANEWAWLLNCRNIELCWSPVRPTWNDVNDGAWHRMTVLFQTNSTSGAPSSRDGIIRVWIDGTLVINCAAAAIGVTPSGGVQAWCTAAHVDGIPAVGSSWIEFSQYHNDTPLNGAGNEDFDDLKVWLIPRS